MGLYEDLRTKNYAEALLEDIERLRYKINEDDTIIGRPESMIPKLATPWIWSGFDRVRLCGVWKGVYLDKYGFVSRNCFNCWKIVLRLDKVTTLFKLLKLQHDMTEENPLKFVGKCGMETRPYSTFKGRYAGFWYASMEDTDGLDEARKLAGEVEERVQNTLAQGLKVVLKRA